MSCSNCFNGCTEITSDKCVKYTGADIPALGIQNGDTLQFVEQALAQFLISALDGSGIKPIVDLQGVCSIVANNIPVCVGCSGPTLNDLLQALIDSACDLQDLINDVSDRVDALEQSYDEGCLTVVRTSLSNTHNVLQAVIDQLCALQLDFDALVLSLPDTYVALNGPGGIQDIITQALEDEGLIGGTTTKQYTKMIPYVAYPWFAPSSYFAGKFDINGAGLTGGEFENVYLCNGVAPGVPDLRGRVLAGVTTGMGGGAMDVAVDPNTNGNPNYFATPSFTKTGVNFVTLGINEIPSHNHPTSSISITDPGHTHTVTGSNDSDGDPGSLFITAAVEPNGNRTVGTQIPNITGITATLTIAPEGQNGAHTNTQPTIGCYYIMYIPA
jgi:microcystin-dependent protein